jgi:hypothetical protein
MANPEFKDLPKDVFTKITPAGGVTTGQVHRIEKLPKKYLQTYKLTGETAPANDPALGVPLFQQGISEQISSSAAIDVYIMPIGKDGRVRVDV